MKKPKDNTREQQKAEIAQQRQARLKELAEQQADFEANMFMPRKMLPWYKKGWRAKIASETGIEIEDKGLFEAERAKTKEEYMFFLRCKINLLIKQLNMIGPGRKTKSNEERKQAADMAHDEYLKGDRKKYSHTGGKNAIASNVAKSIHSTPRTVLRDWEKIYPEDFSK